MEKFMKWIIFAVILILAINSIFLFKLTGYITKEQKNSLDSENQLVQENIDNSIQEENKSNSVGSYGVVCGCKDDGICSINECEDCPDCSDYYNDDYFSIEPKDYPTYEEKHSVSYILDGDTIKLSNGETVRLIGINAPEEGEKCYEEAKEFLEDFILGKEVTLESDIEDKDQYGRLLRYVFFDGHNVNFGMVYLGLAHAYEYGLNTKYSDWFEEAENKAKENEGCLWEIGQERYIKDYCLGILNFHYDAYGNDNYNLNDEYVTFGNICSYSIDMTGWTIKDETASHLYTIPPFTFQADSTFTLFTGTGTNTNSELYWGRTSGSYAAIWNNDGDTLYLRDSKGNLVVEYNY